MDTEAQQTIRRKFDDRTHKAFDTGWQTLTLCGRRGNWLNGKEPIDPGTGTVDCEECLALMTTTTTTNEVQQIAMNGTILSIIAGSTLHGLDVAGQDDLDLMGICIEPPEYVIGLKRFEQYVERTRSDGTPQPEGARSGHGDRDLVIYSLRKWAKLAAKGNPTTLLPLFAPRPHITHGTSEGFDLRRNRHLFITKQAGERFMGYLLGQRSRLLGERGGAPKRPELIEQYGYDTKFAMHATRLALQGIELMSRGQITLPMPGSEQMECMDIRLGRTSEERVLERLEFLERLLRVATDESTLPEHPDMDAINALLIELYQGHWG